ncbi:MAG: HEAT repeat domain-containing protein [Planctomycetes bacterium]|nr:HEAT repeat domain-containing protein [Planctomycetota bacterium]
MNRTILVLIGIFCALVSAAGIMQHNQIQSIKLPIMILSRTEGRGFPGLEQQKTVYLPNDYGFLLNYLGQTEPEFYLYNRPSWTITVTGDFRQFIAGLKQFPDGAKVDQIHKCQVSFEYGMPGYEGEWLDEIIKEKKFRMTDYEDNNFMIECCEFQETLFMTTGRPAEGIPEPATEKVTSEQVIELADKLYNGSPDEVYVTVKALRELKSREAIKQVIGFLSHPASETRGAAADILGFWQAEKAIPPLIRLLSDPDAEVRNSSVYALKLLRAREAIPAITGLLSDSDAQVRCTAVDTLDELYATRENAPAIIKLLADPDEEVRFSAIWALNKSEEAIPDIKRLLSDPKDKVRKAAEEVLRDFGVIEAEIEENLQTKVFQLNYILLADVDDKQDNPDFQSLRPKMVRDFIDRLNAIKSKEGTITLESDRYKNRIIICDTPQVLEEVQKIIYAEDKPPIQYQIKTAAIILGAPETPIKIQAECDNKKLDEALATLESKYKARVALLPSLLLVDGQPGTCSLGEVEKDGTEKRRRASFLVQPAEKSTIFLSVKISDTWDSARKTSMQVKTRLMNNTILVLQPDNTKTTVNQEGIFLTDTFWLVEVTNFKNKEGK